MFIISTVKNTGSSASVVCHICSTAICAVPENTVALMMAASTMPMPGLARQHAEGDAVHERAGAERQRQQRAVPEAGPREGRGSDGGFSHVCNGINTAWPGTTGSRPP